MDARLLARGTSVAILAVASPVAFNGSVDRPTVNDACASTGRGCCSDPLSWCYLNGTEEGGGYPIFNYFWWEGLNCPKS